jgi:hypothetical protein
MIQYDYAKKKKRVLMTRPDGQPAEVPAHLVEKWKREKGYKEGYEPPKEKKK